MRKLTLDPDALRVETFASHAESAGAPGTVRAAGTGEGCDPAGTRWNEHTCDVLSCGGTCLLTGFCCPNNSAYDPCG